MLSSVHGDMPLLLYKREGINSAYAVFERERFAFAQKYTIPKGKRYKALYNPPHQQDLTCLSKAKGMRPMRHPQHAL